jgi:hypothetical protein
LTQGSFSGSMLIDVLTGVRKCTEAEAARDTFTCLFVGMPIIRRYETQLVTGTILPGSSGSAVFNDKGEVAGVVFAGRSREMSYAFIVPHAYVSDFVTNQESYPFVYVDYVAKSEQSQESQKKSRYICNSSLTQDLPLCKNAIESLVWEK